MKFAIRGPKILREFTRKVSAEAFGYQPWSGAGGAAELVGQFDIARQRPRLDECVDTQLQLIRKLPDD